MKRILTILLAALLMLSVAGCKESPKKALSEAYTNLNEAESMRMEMEERVSIRMQQDGETHSILFAMQVVTDMHKPTRTMQIGEYMTYEYDGEPMAQPTTIMELRVFQDGDARKGAFSRDGESWVLIPTLEAVIQERWDLSDEIKIFFEHGDRFKKTGTETVDGVQTTVYEGMFDSESMKGLLKEYLNGTDGVPLITLRDEIWDKLPEIGVKAAIDENGYPVVLEIDGKDFAAALFEQLLGPMLQSGGTAIEFDEMTVTIRYSRFNFIEPFTAPDNLIEDDSISYSSMDFLSLFGT